MKYVCPMCKVGYDVSPLYHICPNGVTYGARAAKSTMFRAAVPDPEFPYLTAEDVKFLLGELKIIW